MPFDKEKLFRSQRDVFKDHVHHIDPTFLKEYSQRAPIAPEQGEGFFDFHFFDNVLLGRADFTFFTDTTFNNTERHFSYGIQLMLSGEVTLALAEPPQQFVPKAPEIWLTKGDLGDMQVGVDAHQRVRNILIEFSPAFIEPLGKEAHPQSLCRQLIDAQSPCFIRMPAPSPETIELAWKLYDCPGAKSHLELMSIQGVALSLVSHLLNTQFTKEEKHTPAVQAAIRAQNLLDDDYAAPWRIREISRRVGVNECDLKREFKRLTGSTLNQYQRDKRMHVALSILQSGEKNLTQVAADVGYQSKDYFVRVFKQFYGFHPKEIL